VTCITCVPGNLYTCEANCATVSRTCTPPHLRSLAFKTCIVHAAKHVHAYAVPVQITLHTQAKGLKSQHTHTHTHTHMHAHAHTRHPQSQFLVTAWPVQSGDQVSGLRASRRPTLAAVHSLHASMHTQQKQAQVSRCHQPTPRTPTPQAMRLIQEAGDPAASHNCFAWKVGAAHRSSDDGEPGGTAGEHQELRAPGLRCLQQWHTCQY
jgi:hypothetical protein